MLRLRLFAIVASLLGAASALEGQCAPVPGSGCPGAATAICTGSAQLGQVITLACQSPSVAFRSFSVLGACSASPLAIGTPAIPIPTWNGRICNLVIDPATAVVVDNGFGLWSIRIPNVPALAGSVFCFQCADFLAARSGSAVLLSGAVTFRILP